MTKKTLGRPPSTGEIKQRYGIDLLPSTRTKQFEIADLHVMSMAAITALLIENEHDRLFGDDDEK